MGTRIERDALVRDNLAIVGYLVNEVSRKAPHVSRDELASAGSLGLLLAAETFDPAQGVPFGAFARRRILGAIADEMRAADWATRTARKRIRESLTVQESLTGALGRKPTVDEVAESLGVDRKTAMEALSGAHHAVESLDESIGDVLATEAAGPEDLVLATERTRYVTAAVRSLPARMRYVVEQIYFHDRGVGELATELGLTHSAVSQQRSEAVRMMRQGLETQYPTGEVPRVAAATTPTSTPARRAAYLARLAETSTARMAGEAPRGAGSIRTAS